MKIVNQWLLYSLLSVAVGFSLGFILAWLWFFISLIYFRYGDSAPSWVNIVTDSVFYGSILIGVVGGQLLFAFRERVINAIGQYEQKKAKHFEKGEA